MLQNTLNLTTLAALRAQLGDDFDFEYIDGSYPWPAGEDVEASFGKQRIYYSYHNGTAESIVEAVDDLHDYLDTEGPFDAVLAFSCGAALISTLLCRNAQRGIANSKVASQSDPKLKCAIFLCALQPVRWDCLLNGSVEAIRPDNLTGAITLPTVHVMSPEDIRHFGESTSLLGLCDRSSAVEIQHSLGHAVPFAGENLSKLVEAIQALMP